MAETDIRTAAIFRAFQPTLRPLVALSDRTLSAQDMSLFVLVVDETKWVRDRRKMTLFYQGF